MSELNPVPVAPETLDSTQHGSSPHGHTPHGHVTGATRFEGTDARAGIVIWSLAIIGAVLIGSFALTIGIQKYLERVNPVGELPSPLAPDRVLPPDPQIEVHPWDDLPQLRAHEDQILNGYGRDANGQTHIPINRAMEAVLPSLKVRPGAPPGLTTPGGEGRSSESANRVPYRIEIKGSVQPNAK